jgi:hypothetical protein
MIFYYEKNTDRFILATNIRAVSEFSGLPYSKVRSWFLDGLKIHKDDNVICIEADVVRGKQKFSKKEVPLGPEGMKYVEQLIKDKRVFPMVESVGYEILDVSPTGGRELPKRETKQPGSRDMKEFDDFFKEV